MTATTKARNPLEQAQAEFKEAIPDHLERLEWSAQRIAEEQTHRLRALLSVAKERSRYHSERLRGVDPATFTLDDLGTLPVMTKAEMMDRFDEAVTDPRLTKAGLQAHISAAGERPELYAGEHFVFASGGSSGVTGMYAYHHSEAAEFLGAVMRPGFARVAAEIGWPPPGPVPTTLVAAPTAVHATRGLLWIAEGVIHSTSAPVTLPFEVIVARVQASQPVILVGYPSMIARLADEQTAGRLEIGPQAVIVTSEQLTDDLSERISRGFGFPPANSFGSSEGLLGSAPPGSRVFDFAGDLAVLEFVDEHDQPVGHGEPAHHVLVTNLFNHTQPLIRYRLDDRMTAVAGVPPGHPRATLEGRVDEVVRVGGVPVHALVVRSVLVRAPGVAEYRVVTRGRDVEISVVPDQRIDIGGLQEQVTDVLTHAGAAPDRVSVVAVGDIPRNAHTGKIVRFVNT